MSMTPIYVQTNRTAKVTDYLNDEGISFNVNQVSNPLSQLFAEKLNSFSSLSKEVTKNVMDKSAQLAALIGLSKLIKAIAKVVEAKFPEIATNVKAKIPEAVSSISGTNLVKFLGVFMVAKAALQPLIEKISEVKSVEEEAVTVEETKEETEAPKEDTKASPNPGSSIPDTKNSSASSETETPKEKKVKKEKPSIVKQKIIQYVTPLFLTTVISKKCGFNSGLGILVTPISYVVIQKLETTAFKFLDKAFVKKA